MCLQAAFKRAPPSSSSTGPSQILNWENVKPEEMALVFQVRAVVPCATPLMQHFICVADLKTFICLVSFDACLF